MTMDWEKQLEREWGVTFGDEDDDSSDDDSDDEYDYDADDEN
jgi:hypothetical protein